MTEFGRGVVEIGPGMYWCTSVLPEDYLPGGKYWDEDVRGVHACMRGTEPRDPDLYLWALYTQFQSETHPADLSSLPRNGHLLEVV